MFSKADVDRIIDESPIDLANHYEGICHWYQGGNGEAQKKILLWAVYG